MIENALFPELSQWRSLVFRQLRRYNRTYNGCLGGRADDLGAEACGSDGGGLLGGEGGGGVPTSCNELQKQHKNVFRDTDTYNPNDPHSYNKSGTQLNKA